MKNLKETIIEESEAQELLNQMKLVKFVEDNKQICKDFVRTTAKKFDEIGLNSNEAAKTFPKDKKKVNQIKKILDETAKKIFGCTHKELDKKTEGLADSLFKTAYMQAIRGIAGKDTKNDWPAMYWD